MRLTLRTMLAYLDDCLDPGDAEGLGAKIAESEFASKLVHRVRNSMRRQRLAAPKVLGRGMGQDANTVAEYIDSTLPAERVPDFEKICLESDIHLAEAAACHQILTLVLRKPAQVEPALRERVYRIPAVGTPRRESADSAAAASAAGADKGAGVMAADLAAPLGAAKSPAREKAAPARPEVPEYLRQTRRPRIWPVALTLVGVFAVVVVGLRLLGPFDRQHPLIAPFVGNREVSQRDGDEEEPKADARHDDAAADDRGSADADNSSEGVTGGDDSGNPATTDGETGDDGAAVTTDADSAPPAPADGAAPPPATDGGAPPPAADGDAPPPIPPPPPVGPPPVEPPGDGGDGPPATPGDPPPARPVIVGTFTGDEQVLARYDKEKSSWVRLAANQSLLSDQRLLVLPTYQPQINFAAGMVARPTGPTEFTTLRPADGGMPGMSVSFGRLTLVTTGRAGTRIALRLGSRRVVLTLVDADSSAAIDVRRHLPAGADPLSAAEGTSPVVSMVLLFVTQGQVEWIEDGVAETLDMGQAVQAVNDAPASIFNFDKPPSWKPDEIDKQASETIEFGLPEGEPVLLKLVELAEDRRVEVRSLSTRFLGYLHYFDPFVRELNDAAQKSYWDDDLTVLRDALSGGPEPAALVKKTFEKHRAADAETLYRMLRGYSPEQLAAGGAAELVAALESKEMDMRVLAIETLKLITGKSYLYRPDLLVGSVANRTAIGRWQDEQRAGGITYRIPPGVSRPAGTAPPPPPAADLPSEIDGGAPLSPPAGGAPSPAAADGGRGL